MTEAYKKKFKEAQILDPKELTKKLMPILKRLHIELQLDEPEDIYTVLLAHAVLVRKLKLNNIINMTKEEIQQNPDLYKSFNKG